MYVGKIEEVKAGWEDEKVEGKGKGRGWEDFGKRGRIREGQRKREGKCKRVRMSKKRGQRRKRKREEEEDEEEEQKGGR